MRHSARQRALSTQMTLIKRQFVTPFFDVLTTEEFDAGVSEGGYGYRRSFLDQLHRFIPQDGRVNILPFYITVKTRQKIDELLRANGSGGQRGLNGQL